MRNSHQDGGAWSSILKRIHQQSNPKPCCRSAAQQFMHEEPAIVNVAFIVRYGEGGGMDQVKRMNKRNKVAKKLVASSYNHLVADLEERAKETHQRDLKEWKLELDDIEEAEDVQMYVFVCCLSVDSH